MTNQPKEQVLRERWEELFDKAFSFEGNNHPDDTPKMMFVIHNEPEEGFRSLATPEYVKAFIREAISTTRREVLEEVWEELEKEIFWSEPPKDYHEQVCLIGKSELKKIILSLLSPNK